MKRCVLRSPVTAAILLIGCFLAFPISSAAAVNGWLNWRGPHQNGTSQETGLPEQIELDGENHLWSYDLPGRGTAVIAQYGSQQRAYVVGYAGQGADLRETLICLDAVTGKVIWQHFFSDFLSDIIYQRYAIGAPAVDPETGNVYLHTSPGLLVGFDPNGKKLWERSMMEELGRMTFPNGRTGAPAIDGDLVIINCISANWGKQGPGRNRFYAFNKHTGKLVWTSTPGIGPPFLKDSSFSSPVFAWRRGKRVFYAGTGCGNVVCVNSVTGEPIWRFQLAIGGVNSSPLLYGDRLIAIHGKENIDDTGRGRMVAMDVLGKPKAGVLDQSAEIWRNNDLSMFTSSPVIVGNRIYQVTAMGVVVCVDAQTGKTLWRKKLGSDQLHASPLYGDGKLYIPMWHDGLYIIEPTERGAVILQQVALEGLGIGSPSLYRGKLYVHTTKKLYCFGRDSAPVPVVAQPMVDKPNYPKPVSRPRNLPLPPYTYDFDAFTLGKRLKNGTAFAFPPAGWIGAKIKWAVQQIDGNNVLAKRLDRILFQRSMVFYGYASDRNYTVAADVMSDGNRRIMSDVGVINQRYLITLRGNGQRLEVNSNIERLSESVAFGWRPGTWYRLKTRVDVAQDGSGVVRAKVWRRSSEEPDSWTLQVRVHNAHTHGSPGIFGFTPQSKFSVYIDNLSVTYSEP